MDAVEEAGRFRVAPIPIKVAVIKPPISSLLVLMAIFELLNVLI
jgi:hypothetical protein